MKNKILVISISLFLIIVIWNNISYGFIKNDYGEKEIIVRGYVATQASTEAILKDLQETGYTGNKLDEEMKIKSRITIIDVKEKRGKKTYKIVLGNTSRETYNEWDKIYKRVGAKDYFSYDDLKEYFGLGENVSESLLNKEYYWDANVIVVGPKDYEKADTSAMGMGQYILYLKSLYTGDDLSKIDGETVSDEENPSDVADFQNGIYDAANKTLDFLSSEEAKKFAKNPIGYVLTPLYDGLRDILGDYPMVFAHAITFSNTKITYKVDELKSDENSAINKYTNVGEYENKEINLKPDSKYKDEEYRRFSSNSEIPVFFIDLYNIATDNVEIFDTNFLEIDTKKHSDLKNSPWVYLRNVEVLIIRMSIYLCAAYLLITLIYNGILITKSSLTNPIEKTKAINKIKSICISAFMLIGAVLIMALSIYGSKFIISKLKIEDKTEFPIRVNVEEAGYSFSTNITGYFRYRTEIEGIQNYREKGLYTGLYIALSWTNVILAVFFMLRVFVMAVLAVIGPIIAVQYSVNIENSLRYRSWCKIYARLALVQIFFVLLYKLISVFF